MRQEMLEDSDIAMAIVRNGHEIIPTWRISTPDGHYRVLTRFNPDQPEQVDRAFSIIPRFLSWKSATSFLLTVEMWLGSEKTREGEEAVLTIGHSRNERLCLIHRILRSDAEVTFGPAEWLTADQVDDLFWKLLPSGAGELSDSEVTELVAMFGAEGEWPAARLN